jgi:hypothetical protein
LVVAEKGETANDRTSETNNAERILTPNSNATYRGKLPPINDGSLSARIRTNS